MSLSSTDYAYAVAFMLTSLPDERFSLIEIGLTLGLMFLELIDILCARAIRGFADNFRCDFSTNPAESHRIDARWAKTKFLGKFMLGQVSFCPLLQLVLGVFYCSIYDKFGSNSFVGLLNDGTPVWLQLMYFSIATVATVGYGDIHPGIGVAQALVALEILFGMAVVIFLLLLCQARLHVNNDPTGEVVFALSLDP